MAHDLPAGVRHWLAGQAEGVRLSALREQHGTISRHYRAGGASSGVVDSSGSVLAYALGRMPATYAACHAALRQLVAISAELAPESLIDLGCGTGAATLAALETFPGLRAVRLIDHNAPFLRFAETLLRDTGAATGRDISCSRGNIIDAGTEAADIVAVSYALVELGEGDARRAVLNAWARTRMALLLVEPGSRAGFSRILAARKALIAAGARIAAPCTHHATCPTPEGDWCHFSVRLARSRGHRFVKGADAPFEDEKFSYLIAVRAEPRVATRGRIVAPPRHEKGGSRFRLCNEGGLHDVTVATRDPAHKRLKKLMWGELMPSDGADAAN